MASKHSTPKPNRIVAAAAIGEVVAEVRRLIRRSTQTTDSLMALETYLQKLTVDGQGRLDAWKEGAE